MILARISKAVREQNWFAVALEFVIVVAGVVIGFQATQWANSRAAAERQETALLRLHDEVENAAGILSWMVGNYDGLNADRAEAIERLIAADFEGMDTDSMTASVLSISLLPAFSPRQGVYNEIVSSGMLSSLGDADFRDALGEYQAAIVFLQGQIDYIRVLSAGDADTTSFDFVWLEYAPGTERGRRHVIDWDAAAADPDFLQHVLEGNNRMRAMTSWWRNTLEDALILCEDTARLTGRACEPENWAAE